jgi:hypothetical protein
MKGLMPPGKQKKTWQNPHKISWPNLRIYFLKLWAFGAGFRSPSVFELLEIIVIAVTIGVILYSSNFPHLEDTVNLAIVLIFISIAVWFVVRKIRNR